MDLKNEFEVAVPIAKAWEVLTDLERIAPCMPGAQLQEVEGEEYRGLVKVKVGPITAQYKGKATFVEKDDDNYRAELKADGRDTRGQGNANATIVAALASTETGTKVTVDTDLAVTGKVAQMGRGVMADVSAKLLDQFVENLEAMLEADEAPLETSDETASDNVDADTESDEAAVTSGVKVINQPEPEPVDLLETAGAPVAKRVVPAVVGVLVLLLIWRWLRNRNN
ncbi:MAG: SRPBCC family protein [Acidimicrobiia bacterium]